MQILFAHGAGLPSSHPWMEGWAHRLEQIGPVHRFDYPYMQRGSKRPDRHPVLLQAHREAYEALEGPVLLAGKSMGSRIGCHLAVEVPVVGTLCFGYPLVSASGKLRDEVLVAQTRPVCFVQGTRDRMCPLDLLDEVRARMSVPTEVIVVPTGDHSLRCTKTHLKQTGQTQQDEDQRAFEAIRTWVAGVG